MASKIVKVNANWHHLLRDTKHSAQDFYGQAEKIIKQRDIPDCKYSRVTFSDGGFFSEKREYLRVARKEYVFDICAAPFGKDFFISWWLGETESGASALRTYLMQLPVIGSWFVRRKTYFQMDNENMFLESVKACINEAVESAFTAKGSRMSLAEEPVVQNN